MALWREYLEFLKQNWGKLLAAMVGFVLVLCALALISLTDRRSPFHYFTQ